VSLLLYIAYGDALIWVQTPGYEPPQKK